MSYDNASKLIAYRKGEVKPIYGTLTSSSGNQTVTNAKFTLLNSAGTAVISAATASISGSPGLVVQVYYLLDSSALTESSWYYGYFTESDIPTDTLNRNLQPTLAIWIAPLVEATYDLTTDIGNVRLMIADTNIPDVVFSDVEVNAFLTAASGKRTIAAALALASQATDRAKLALSMNTSTWGTDQNGVYDALMKQSEYYRRISPSKAYVPVTDAIFTIGSLSAGTTGTIDTW